MKARILPLLVSVALVVVGGGLVQRRDVGLPPAPCPQPVRSDGLLRCDGEGEPPGAAALLVGQRININTARAGDIAVAPRVGGKLAASIVHTRDARGGFATMAEVRMVPGVGGKTLATLTRLFAVRDGVPLDVHSDVSGSSDQPPRSDAKVAPAGPGEAGRVP